MIHVLETSGDKKNLQRSTMLKNMWKQKSSEKTYVFHYCKGLLKENYGALCNDHDLVYLFSGWKPKIARNSEFKAYDTLNVN